MAPSNTAWEHRTSQVARMAPRALKTLRLAQASLSPMPMSLRLFISTGLMGAWTRTDRGSM